MFAFSSFILMSGGDTASVAETMKELIRRRGRPSSPKSIVCRYRSETTYVQLWLSILISSTLSSVGKYLNMVQTFYLRQNKWGLVYLPDPQVTGPQLQRPLRDRPTNWESTWKWFYKTNLAMAYFWRHFQHDRSKYSSLHCFAQCYD